MKNSILRNYVLNTSFHGFRYIAEKDRHWTERVFWTICCLLSWIASGLLILASWDDFQNNAISFVVETSYLDWDTQFPSVIICETDNQKKIAEVTDKIFGDPHDYNLDEIIKELVYFHGLSFYTLQICGPSAQNNECITRNFSIYSDLVRSSCPEIFKTCKWNEETFDCCRFFHRVDTELGTCYGINSMQTRIQDVPHYPMVSNKNTGPGTFYMELFGYSNVYILGEQEVPSLTTLQTDVLHVTPHIHYHRFLAIKEIENQPEVKDVSVQQRKCRFMFETDLDVYPHYSYSACSVQCRKDAQMDICKCSHHLIPKTDAKYHCDIEGLDCLNKNYNKLAVLKAPWANRTGLVCNCLPSCTELEMSIIKDDKTGIQEEFAIVELSLERLPSERFKRTVVRGQLDLVVSMGGTTALFIGASILSFVEIIYYFLVKPIMDALLLDVDKQNGEDEPLFYRSNRLPPIE